MSTSPQDPPQTVRFSDIDEEIEPAAALQHVSDLTGAGQDEKEPLSPEAEQEIRNLSMTLQKSRCQARRMENFSYEPMSLPASRVRQTTNTNISTAVLIASRLLRPRRHRERPRDTRPTFNLLVLVHLHPPPPCIPPL